MPAFNYNTGVGEYIKTGGTRRRSDTKQLGSTLMETMLKEVADFCDPEIKESWTQKGHQQVVKGCKHFSTLGYFLFTYTPVLPTQECILQLMRSCSMGYGADSLISRHVLGMRLRS